MALNLGGLFFTLDADTRGLVNAQRRVEQFAEQVRAAFRGVGRGTVDQSFANSLGRQEAAIVRVTQRISRLQQVVSSANLTPRGAREAQVAMERLGMTFDNYTRKLTSGALDSNLFARRQAAMMQSMTGAERSIRGLVSASSSATRPVRGLADVLMGLGSASLFVQGHFGGFSTRFFGLTGLVRELGPQLAIVSATLVGLGAGFAILAEHAITSGRALQILQIQFKAISGSSAVAAHDIKFLRDVADVAGLQFNSLAESYTKFNAAATSSGLTLNQTEGVFRKVSMAAGTMHLSNEKVQLSFLALEQMLSKGTVYTEELRRQLGDQLPGAMAIAANAMGVTQSKLMVMLKQGIIPATEFVPKFADALMKVWNINPDRPINSLQASLNRLNNQWTYLGQNIADTTGLLVSAQRFVDGLTNVVKMLGQNLATTAGIVGGFVGALAGLLVVATITRLVGLLITGMTILRGVIIGLTEATVALDAAMLANAAGGLAKIALVVTGAVLGYNYLSGAMSTNDAAVASQLKSMQDYIAKSEQMGSQIKSVTQDIFEQAKALATTAQGQALAAAQKVNAPGMGISIPGLGEIISVHHDRTAAKKEYDAALAQFNAYRKVVFDIKNNVSKLPELGASPVDRLDKTAKNKGLDGIINKAKDLMQAAETAEGALRALFAAANQGLAPGDAGKRVEDLGKALEIVNNLKPKQLAAAAGVLGVANNVESVTEALTGYIRRAREAAEISADFLKVWTSADEARVKVQGLTTSLHALQAGFDPHKMRFLDNLTQAQEQLRDLNNKVAQGGTIGQEASQALDTLQALLGKMGFQGANAAEGIALLNTRIQDMQDGAKLIEDMSTKFRDLEDSVRATVRQMLAYQGFNGNALNNIFQSGTKGNLEKFGFGADVGEAFQRAYDRGKQVLDLRRQMEQLPGIFSQDDINSYSSAFLGVLRNLDTYKERLADAQKAAERNRDAVRSWVNDGLNGIKDFLQGTKSLKNALLDVAKSLTDTAWQTFIIGPANDWLSKLGRNAGNKAASGVDSNVASDTANQLLDLANAAGAAGDATKGEFLKSILGVITGQTTQQSALITSTAGLMTLAGAANAASAALAGMAASGGSKAGSGILAALANVAGAAFGGVNLPVDNIDPGSLFTPGGSFFPRGMTGPVTAGQGYRINEPGIMGEYFIPRVNGYMSPNAPGGGGQPVVIDASVKYIDARGATPDAIALLDQKMQARERRFKQELPFLIDQRVQDSGRRGRY